MIAPESQAFAADPGRALTMLFTALGADVAKALHAPDTIEIIVNPDGKLWIERQNEGRAFAGAILDATHVERVIRLVATMSGAQAHEDRPIVSAELPPAGERFEGLLPPVSRAPCFVIRKPAQQIFRLANYVAAGALTKAQRNTLKEAIGIKANILIAGGTGSGKTTLANALLAEIADLDERVVILEDTRELNCAAKDVVALRTKSGLISLADLVRSTLRLRPDRIVVGEVRGPEALDLLKAWNTGHPGGIATIHANSAMGALSRLEQLCMEVCERPPVTLIHEAIDLIVFIARGGPSGRIVTDIVAPKHLAMAQTGRTSPGNLISFDPNRS